MESNKQICTKAGLQVTTKSSQRYSSNPLPTSKSHSFFFIVLLSGLMAMMCLLPTLSSAAPPEWIISNFKDAELPEQAQSTQRNKEPFARGRILVEPRAGLPARAFSKILEEHGGKARKIGQSNLYIIDLPQYSEEGIIVRLEHHPHLKFIELDYLVSPSFIPNDPYYGNTWHLPKIGAPSAWDHSQGNGITIAILDTGVDNSHPDLAERLIPGWNFLDNNSDTLDINGHGTSVAGTAAASSNNNMGVAAVAGQSKILPLRISSTGITSFSLIVEALIYAADNGARVANASFAGLTTGTSIQNAAQYMKDKGGLVTVGAANTGRLESYPATSTMIPVSATDSNDVKTTWSSYGDYVAISAPGDGIWTTKMGGDYRSAAGTSYSSPVTAGVIALMMSANPTLSSTEIEDLLFSTAVDLGDPGRDPYYGYGRVDASAAVQAAVEAIPMVDTKAPTATIVDPLDGATVVGLVPVDIEATDNVGVTRAELWVNNTAVAVDTSSPFAFTWDSSGVPDGITDLVAYVFDAAGNKTSSAISVNVDNQIVPITIADTEPPAVQITNPVAGNVSGNITISTDAIDNYGASGITQSIYIDGLLVATGTGSTLAYSWNTRPKRVNTGKHTILAVASDAAGNSTSTSVIINVIK